ARARQPRALRQRGSLPAGTGAALRPLLALRRTREPDSQTRRLLRLRHGRRIGHPHPRPGAEDSRLLEHLPASRHEGVSLRRGQHAGLHLSLPWLELRHRRPARGSSLLQRMLRGAAGQGRMGVGGSPAADELQRHDLGHGAVSFLQLDEIPYTPSYQNTPIVEEYFRHCYEERKRRLGKDARLLGLVGNVFPNTAYLARQPRSIAVWHPRGALRTEAWR